MTIMVSPPATTMQTTEELPLGFDTSALLELGQSVTMPSATLTDLTESTTITLANRPSVNGNVITQIVDGSQLSGNHVYRLTVSFTAAADTNWSMPLQITVPF